MRPKESIRLFCSLRKKAHMWLFLSVIVEPVLKRARMELKFMAVWVRKIYRLFVADVSGPSWQDIHLQLFQFFQGNQKILLID